MIRTIVAVSASLLLAATPAWADGTRPSHGISVFGELKYPPGFKHFDYVNPDAPKGGELRLQSVGTYETVNPFILKGREEALAGIVFDTLMARAMDEPDAVYGLIAKSVELSQDGNQIVFDLDTRARFHDGTAVTAADVVYSFDTLVKEGHPRFRIIYRDVAKAEALGPAKVRFVFKPGVHRDLPTRLAGLPVLSKAYYAKVKFNETTFVPPLGSGPYRIAKAEPGRTVIYQRVADYWARDLPVNRGRHNFERVRVDYYRDRDIAFQAFFAGQYDFREEFTSRSWATQYDKPPVNKRLIVRETLDDETPSGAQAFVFNLRRNKFKDRRVRAALDLAFDYEWTNKNLFYSQYQRTNSMFENSELAAHAPPSAAELALLEPLRDEVPKDVFTAPFQAPTTAGTGKIRGNLRKAIRLLRKAGYKIKDGALYGPDGKPFEIEFLNFEPTFNRIVNPYIRNLERLGVKATIRVVDSANFKYRTDNFEFDIIVERFVQLLTPGVELRSYYGSNSADIPGSRNLGGIKDPAVDALIEKVLSARDRPALIAAVRALDRLLMWNRFFVPQWYKGSHNVAYWNKFDRPKVKPRFARGVIDTWWYNAEKARMIADGTPPPSPGN